MQWCWPGERSACGLDFDGNDPSFFFCIVCVVFFAAALPPTVAWVAVSRVYVIDRLVPSTACY